MSGAYSHETAGWKQFWSRRAPGSEHRYRDEGIAAVLHGHWRKCFAAWFEDVDSASLIDLACGEGEVLGLACRFSSEAGKPQLSGFCTDIAADAVAMTLAASGTAGAAGAAADCEQLPFRDGAFRFAVSQYGLEYAGPDAFDEAARIVAPGGRLHALVHCRGGLVEQACQEVADLLDAVRGTQLLTCLTDYCIIVPRAVRGEASHQDAAASADALRQAVERTALVLGPATPGPARDHMIRLLQDCQTLTQRLAAYAPQDVDAWIAAQTADIDAFHHRMTSMVRVARSRAEMEAAAARIAAAGLNVGELATLQAPQQDKPLAWILEARRPI